MQFHRPEKRIMDQTSQTEILHSHPHLYIISHPQQYIILSRKKFHSKYKMTKKHCLDSLN